MSVRVNLDWSREVGPVISGGMVPLRGQEVVDIVLSAAEWVGLPWEEQQQLNNLKLYANQELITHFGIDGYEIRLKYFPPCITSLKEAS